MPATIGLQAVLELGNFSKGVQTYLRAVSQMSAQTTSAASSISSGFVGLGSGVLKFGAIAGGAALAGVGALTAGLVLLGSTALTEFAKYERMSLSVQSLVARDLAQGKLVEQQKTVAIGLTQKESKELDGLAAKIQKEELARNTLGARIREQSEALRQLRDAHGAEALDVQTATARLAELENQYNSSGAEIENMKNRQNELSNSSQRYATVIEKVRTGQMSMTEAMAQAGPKAQELLGWISKLAIQSPFTEEGINNAFQTALAYGFNIDKAKELTQAEVDYAAATGKSVETTNLIALALGQMQAKGKVSGQEIIQLTNAGVGVNRILEDMGFNLSDVSNGLVDSDKFINAVIADMQIFKGAGAAQANTFSGLISTLGDLKAIGLREFFTGTFTTIQPYLASFVGMLTSAALETGSIRTLGDAFGKYVATGLQKVVSFAGQMKKLFSTFQTGGTAGLVAALGITPDAIALIGKFKGMITGIANTIAGPLMAALSGVSGGGVLESINQGITFLNEHFAELQAALIGVGAVLATGVFAALVAGVLSLISPIGLIIAAVATLNAAWVGNWGNIQGIVLPVIDAIIKSVTILQAVFAQFGAMGAGVSLLSMLGLSPETIGVITTGIQSILDAFSSLSTWWVTNWPIMQAAALTAWVVIQGIFAGFQNVAVLVSAQMQQAFANVNQALANLGLNWTDIWNALKTATGIVLAAIGVLILGVIAAVGGLVTGIATALNAATAIWQNFMATITTIITGLSMQFAGALVAWEGIISGNWSQIWQGVVLTLQGAITTIKGLLSAMATLFLMPFSLALEAAKGFVQGVIAVFAGLYDTLVGNSIIPDLVNGIVKWFKDLPQKIISSLSGLVSKAVAPFVQLSTAIKDELGESLSFLTDDALPLLGKGFDFIIESIKDLIAYFDSLKSAVNSFSLPDVLTPGSPPPMAYALWDIGDAATSAARAMSGFQNTMIQNNSARFIDDLNMGGFARDLGAGGGWWRDIRSILQDNITGNMGNLAAGMTGGDVMGLIQRQAQGWGIPPQFAASIAEANGMVDTLLTNFQEFKKQINLENLGNMVQMGGTASGVAGTLAEMLQGEMGDKQAAINTVEKLTEAYKKLTGEITIDQDKLVLMQEELGKLITSEGTNQIAIDKKRLAIEQANESLEFGKRQMAIYQQELAALKQNEEKNQLQIEKKVLAMDRLTESMDAQEKRLVTLQEELANLQAANQTDTEGIEKKRLEMEKLTAQIEKNQEAVAANEKQMALLAGSSKAGMIEALKAFLAGTEQMFHFRKEFEDGTTNDTYIDRNAAQAEYIRLLEEQRRQEELIAKQKEAQQKLDKLKAQLDLLNLGRSLGGDIFRGMKFGLDASVEDMLAAANAVTMAMVDQINTDLQIGSPSKLMINTFKQVMAGAAVGMEKGKKLLSDAVRSIPIMNGSIAQPVYSQPVMAGAMGDTYYGGNINLGGVVINNATDETRLVERLKREVVAGFRR